MTIIILQSFVSLRTLRSVRRRTSVVGPTTEWSDYTTRTSTRRNSVIVFLTRSSSASTGTTARSRTRWRTSRCDWSTTCCLRTRTSTSSSSTSRRNGVPTTTSITKHNACTRITSRTSGASRTCFGTTRSSVRTGKAAPSSRATKRAANDCRLASSVTAGRSSSFTH